MNDRLASHLLSLLLLSPLVAPDAEPTVAPRVAPAAAQDADTDDAAPRRQITLADLEVLLGEWKATPSLPQSGPYEVTSRWELVLGESFLRETRVTTQGEFVTEEWTLLGMPKGSRILERWQFGSDGSSGSLPENPDAELRAEGRLRVRPGALWSVAFEGVVSGRPPDGPWRVTLSAYSHDRFDLLIERKPGDAWLPITRQEFLRTAEADGTPVEDRDAAAAGEDR